MPFSLAVLQNPRFRPVFMIGSRPFPLLLVLHGFYHAIRSHIALPTNLTGGVPDRGTPADTQHLLNPWLPLTSF